MAQSKPEVVEAILACLLNNPSSGDEQVQRSRNWESKLEEQIATLKGLRA